MAKGLTVRGHPLVWTVPKALPAWLQKYPYEKQLAFLEHHVRSLIAATGGRVQLWDMVNEMLWEPSLRHVPERDWPHVETADELLTTIEPALHWAREEAPDARLVLNDYGLEVDFCQGVTAAEQRRRYVELITEMQRRGCAPDAVGTQAHVGKWFPMAAVQQTFDQLASTGLPLEISEFWAKPGAHPCPEGRDAAQREADLIRYCEQFYTLAFGHPAVEHLTYWGGEEFFQRDGYEPSPLYEALDELINQRWRTRARITADEAGRVRMRGFHGRYALRWADRHGNPTGAKSIWRQDTAASRPWWCDQAWVSHQAPAPIALSDARHASSHLA
ncbi:MAG: endo-1,4-beta-xylanase [Planctomycetota bacterium]|jgi:endo-1,4-beta-xylanase|nr:endo-1,4-beta-xylanase [Planctomycetota bacterium]